MHFMHRHVENTIAILNEFTSPNPWCNQCDMFIPREALVAGHVGAEINKRVAEHKYRRLEIAVTWESSGM